MKTNLYIELLKSAINNYLYFGTDSAASSEKFFNNSKWLIPNALKPHTLCNRSQLDFLERVMIHLIENKVAGDFVEAGVWRGGNSIFMRGFLKVIGENRQVILIDQFMDGALSTRCVSNEQFDIWTNRLVSEIEEVKTHFRRYGLLDDFISFCHGKISEIEFPDSVSKIALARLDLGSYESYSHALNKIYPLMSKGGCVILGDWHLESCRAAVYDFVRNNKLNVLISELFKGHLADAHFFI
jgi:O-methyltransferase